LPHPTIEAEERGTRKISGQRKLQKQRYLHRVLKDG
jgi:hypothetical protein